MTRLARAVAELGIAIAFTAVVILGLRLLVPAAHPAPAVTCQMQPTAACIQRGDLGRSGTRPLYK